MGEKQIIHFELEKRGKNKVITQTLGLADTTIWNVLKNKETIVEPLSNIHRMGQQRKSSTEKAVRKKTKLVTSTTPTELE